jgi:hypothetical protein
MASWAVTTLNGQPAVSVDVVGSGTGGETMTPLMIGLAMIGALLTMGIISWSISLYFHQKHVHPK